MDRAQRRLIGMLLLDNELFHGTLDDGTHVAEAVAPADLPDPACRLLYQRLFDTLCDDRPATLAMLMAELTESGDTALAGLLREVDEEADLALAEMDAAVLNERSGRPLEDAERPVIARRALIAAVAALGEHRRANDLRRQRQEGSAGDHPADPRRLAMLEALRHAPHPARIARPAATS